MPPVGAGNKTPGDGEGRERMKKWTSKWLSGGTALAVVAGMASFGGMSAPAQAAKVEGPKVVWNLSTWGTPRTATRNFEKLSELLSEATDGNFTLKINWGGTLSAPKENIDGVKIGAFEMALHAISFRPGTMPTLEVMGLPFLPLGDLKAQGQVGLAVYELPTAKKDLERWNIVAIMPLLLTPYQLMGKGKAPLAITDLKGMRVRAPGGLGDAVKTVGAVPTNFASSELYNALERGLLDAVSLANYAHQAYRIYELSEWYTVNLDFGILATVVPANKDSWEALPPQYRKLILDSVQPSLDYQAQVYITEEAEAVQAFNDKGLKALTYSAAALDEFQVAAGKPVWDAWVAEMNGKGYPGQAILDATLAEAKKASM